MIDLYHATNDIFLNFFKEKRTLPEILGKERFEQYKIFTQIYLPNPVDTLEGMKFTRVDRGGMDSISDFFQFGSLEGFINDFLIALFAIRTNGQIRVSKFSYKVFNALNSTRDGNLCKNLNFRMKKISYLECLHVDNLGVFEANLSFPICFKEVENKINWHKFNLGVSKEKFEKIYLKKIRMNVNMFDENINRQIDWLISK